jgi:zinc D-Ala-D-Ala dipeptidase
MKIMHHRGIGLALTAGRTAAEHAGRNARPWTARVLTLATLIALTCVRAQAGDRSPAFVDAGEVVPGLVVEMRYAGEHNFVGARIDGYHRRLCLLTRQAAAAVAEVQRDLAEQGLGLKVFDCYRPARAVAHFVRWAQDSADQRAKSEFYPEVDKGDLFRDGYIADRSGHSRGSTLDLTLVRLAGAQAPDKPATELDMGTAFDLFSPRSWPTDRSVGATAQKNRALLAKAMIQRGFKPYAKEWWHFTLADEPFPDTYFDFPVR